MQALIDSAPSVDSALFRQRAPRVQLSNDPDTATVQTVQEMARQIHGAARDPLVRQCARNAVDGFRGGPAWAGANGNDTNSERRQAESVWWWCKHYLRFKHHGAMFEAWSADLGDPGTKLQLLISPDVLVRMKRMEGDCAIYTMMIAAMLETLGIRWEICTAAVDARQPEIFGHVWPVAPLADGTREPLDASHGPRPGWQVPAYDIHRIWTFDSNGNRVQTANRFEGLHAYRTRSRRRGFGNICTYSDADYDAEACEASVMPGGGSSSVNLGTLYPLGTGGGVPTSPAVAVAPSQSSGEWASFANNLLKQGFTLAQINAIQPGTVVTAGGILRQNPGYAVGSPTSATNLGISTNTLMLGALGIGALFVFGSMMKGGHR